MRKATSFGLSRQGQTIIGFLLFAVLLAGVQAVMLGQAFLAQGYREPADIRSARAQLTEVDRLRQVAAARPEVDLDRLPSRFAVVGRGVDVTQSGTSTPLAGDSAGLASIEENIFTPGLTGILEERDIAGRLRYRACFAQGVFSAGEKVGEFRVRDVYADRVVLQRNTETFVVRLQKSERFGTFVKQDPTQ